ncbi:hypothetical protein MKEN_00903700 [Mycena kentingensis (nom. inval.)]|nr:hypothetical protein MKEN_00903700 [Mycena kentingensis (nom. inval.)]
MANFTLGSFIKSQCAKRGLATRVDLTGKTVLVVGANSGLGFEATKHFATMNPGRLILACRSESKGTTALEQLKSETGCTTAELWLVDLADFDSVKAFVHKFEQDGGRLDILLANAATISTTYGATKQSWETCLQVNCLSLALLAILLLPHMARTAQNHPGSSPRIVLVTSEVHHWATLDKRVTDAPNILETLGSKDYCTPKAMGQRYFLTKLLNILFVRALNAHLPSNIPVIVNCVNPGYCYSNIRSNLSGLQSFMDRIMERVIALPTEVGSRQLVWACIGQEEAPEKLRGEYISLEKVDEVSDYILSPEGATVQERIWEEMLDILGKADSRVAEVSKEYFV